jgi:hypothetical protein
MRTREQLWISDTASGIVNLDRRVIIFVILSLRAKMIIQPDTEALGIPKDVG